MTYARVVTHVENRLVRSAENGITIEILHDIHFRTGITLNVTRLRHYNVTAFSTDSADYFSRDIASELLSNGADLAGSHYFLLYDRVKNNLSVLLPIVNERFSAFFIQPHLTDGRSIFFAPFGAEITILLYSTTIFLMVANVILLWKSNPYNFSKTPFFEAFQNGVWGIICVYALKSFPLSNSSLPVKIFLITSSLFFWIISTIYSAFLLSVLTSSLYPIHSFMDLISHGYSIYTNPSLSSRCSAQYKAHSKPIYGNLNSFKRALEGGHAHVDQAESFSKYRGELGLESTDLCKKIVLVPFISGQSGVSAGFYVSKGFNKNTKESLNRGIAKMEDSGLLHRYNSKYFEDVLTSCPRQSAGYLELTMLHVGRLFEVLGAFAAFSILFLGLELLVSHIHKC